MEARAGSGPPYWSIHLPLVSSPAGGWGEGALLGGLRWGCSVGQYVSSFDVAATAPRSSRLGSRGKRDGSKGLCLLKIPPKRILVRNVCASSTQRGPARVIRRKRLLRRSTELLSCVNPPSRSAVGSGCVGEAKDEQAVGLGTGCKGFRNEICGIVNRTNSTLNLSRPSF